MFLSLIIPGGNINPDSDSFGPERLFAVIVLILLLFGYILWTVDKKEGE